MANLAQWESGVVGWRFVSGFQSIGIVIPVKPRKHNGGARYVADAMAWNAGGRFFQSKREAFAAIEAAAAPRWSR